MKAIYNTAGQMIGEKWFDTDSNLTEEYKYTYDNSGNIVRSIDIFANEEYNYEYEDGKIIRSTECDIILSEAKDIVLSKTLSTSISYR